MGRLQKTTSYDAAAGDTVISETPVDDDGWGRVLRSYMMARLSFVIPIFPAGSVHALLPYTSPQFTDRLATATRPNQS